MPIKTGDKFKVVFKSNSVPYQAFSRQHYMSGMSFVNDDGQSWKDITLDNKTVCLKVYTLAVMLKASIKKVKNPGKLLK